MVSKKNRDKAEDEEGRKGARVSESTLVPVAKLPHDTLHRVALLCLEKGEEGDELDRWVEKCNESVRPRGEFIL